MTGRAEEYERTTGFAEIALGQMKALRHANNPRNYEIWYTYATGYHPALNAQINATLKAKGTITEADDRCGRRHRKQLYRKPCRRDPTARSFKRP
jgi:diguanylate cyclase